MKKNYFFVLFFCTFLSSVTCAQVPVMNPIMGSSTVCSTPAVPESYSASASNAPTSYSWSVMPSSSVVIANPSGSVTSISFPNTNSSYTIYCYATNGFGSSTTTSFVVTVFETPTVTFSGATIFCQGSGTNLSASPTIISASSTLSYSWSPSIGLSSTTLPNVNANPPSTTTYSVLLTIGACTNMAMVTVSVVGFPSLFAMANPTSICQGQTSTLNIGGTASTYSIYAQQVGPSTTVSPNSTTSYVVGATGSNGCMTFTQVAVNVNPLPVVNLVANPSILCQGKTATLSINTAAGISYSLNQVPFTSATQTVAPGSPSGYTVLAQDANGCMASAQATVNVVPNPTVSASSSPAVICKGNSATLTISGNATSYSVNSQASPVISVISPTTTLPYTIDAVNINGCTAKTVFTQSVATCTGIFNAGNEPGRLRIYPNPNNGTFNVRAEKEGSAVIMNELGQVIRTLILVAGTDNTVFGLSPGIYFMKSESSSGRFIVTE